MLRKSIKLPMHKNLSLYSLKTALISPPNAKNHMAHVSIIVFGAPGSVKEASSKSLTETLTLQQIM